MKTKMKTVEGEKIGALATTTKKAGWSVASALVVMAGSLNAGSTDHLDMGLELVDNLLARQSAGQFEDDNQVKLNDYGGSWGQGTLLVQVGEPAGNVLPYNLSICGSFVTKLLNQSYNWNWSEYEFFDPNAGDFVTTASPNSHRYMELIKQQIGFESQIFNLVDVMPGDVMVKRDVGTTSGHVWVIKEVHFEYPMFYPADTPDSVEALIGTTYFEVDVLDCSSGHHSNDTRMVEYNGLIHETNGAGVGTMGLLVDDQGVMMGHTWSLPSASYDLSLNSWVSQLNDRLRLFGETELVVGRLALDQPSEDNDPKPQPEDESEEQTEEEPEAQELAGPHFFELGQLLLQQILAAQADGIFVDEDGVDINRRGGSWSSQSNPVMIRFADPEQNILPANYTKGTTLVTLLLAEAYDWDWNDYEFFDTKKGQMEDTASPSSTRYVDLIEQNVGFESQIMNLTDVEPGDVMAIRYLSNWSGHTTMVHWIDWDNARAYPSDHANADPAWAGCWYVPVEVLDSTADPHSFDTREVNGEELEGIGLGTMGVLINGNAEVVGHTWSLPSSDYETQQSSWLSSLHSRLKPQTERRMVFGRHTGN